MQVCNICDDVYDEGDGTGELVHMAFEHGVIANSISATFRPVLVEDADEDTQEGRIEVVGGLYTGITPETWGKEYKKGYGTRPYEWPSHP